EEYVKIIKRISLILEGKGLELIKGLTAQMRERAKERRFEEAGQLRDKIIALSAFKPSGDSFQSALNELQEALRLPCLPQRIEAFDVSNISGRQATASMVSFYNGLADKDNYRRFRIKTVSQSDDYKMMAEAVRRRYRRLKEEGRALPDLILVDGGRGQLSAAKDELRALGLDIPIVSLAKREEEIYTLRAPRPIRLKNNSPALRLVQHIRDESHRFALKYHRLLRKKKFLSEKE
ncbi:MAG TPA: UvrB/UvrC motif-containing protein, partial [Candidatus Omnitrophota bacterium]|nr:UvrB/UvrC motif-containing protein [Candidatus Omnitrophota bacterium]